MINISIFWLLMFFAVDGVICLMVGAGLRDARAKKDLELWRNDSVMLQKELIDLENENTRFMHIEEELEKEMKEAQDLWHKYLDDHSRGRIQALRHMILYIKGRI